jgi:hypothetical protein
MIINMTLDLDKYRSFVKEFEIKEKDEEEKKQKISPDYIKKTRFNYTESPNFMSDIGNPFRRLLKEQISDNVKRDLGQDATKEEIKIESKKIYEKIKRSPAGYNLSKFGLAEYLKNATHDTAKATKLNIILKMDEQASALDPRGLEILVIDNGGGFPKNYLDKDSDKKNNNTLLANVRKVKDPGYEEGRVETSVEVIDRKKTISDKQESGEISAGKGLNELAKVVSIVVSDKPEKVLGHMLIGNVDDLKKTPYISLANEAKFSLPDHGAITYIHSPILDEDSIKKCDISTRYREFITDLDFTIQAKKRLLEADAEEDFSLKIPSFDSKEDDQQEIPDISHFNFKNNIDADENPEENNEDEYNNDNGYDSDMETEKPKLFSNLNINVDLESSHQRRKKENLTLTMESQTVESPISIPTEPMPGFDSMSNSETPKSIGAPSSIETPFSRSSSLDTPMSTMTPMSAVTPLSPRSDDARSPLSVIDEQPSTPTSPGSSPKEKTPRSPKSLLFFGSSLEKRKGSPSAQDENDMENKSNSKRKLGGNG